MLKKNKDGLNIDTDIDIDINIDMDIDDGTDRTGKKKYKPKDIEKLCADECKQLESDMVKIDKIKKSRKKFNQQMKWKTDSGYYFTVVFQTKEQAEEFLTKIKLKSEWCINGLELAKKLGIKIESENPDFFYNMKSRFNKK